MDAPDSALRPGYRLDRYELLAPIASGGMATVWLARLRGKRGFEKLFAVKTIRTELVGDPRFQEMFLDEARIASGIQHPNVAQILDLGEQNDVLYLVMEWVSGESLDKIRQTLGKRGGRLPVGVTLRVLADACSGLHAAHELRSDAGDPLGIVHRDVSPQNILVSTSGAVKVIDFGIAKAQHRKQGETGIGIVKGKLHYMAPEQVKKERRTDRRTDIWSLGVCLHELVTGKLPYDEDDDVEVIRRLMSNEAPVVVEGIPPAVQKVLDRSLALSPDQRFATAAVMQRGLEAAMNELGELKTSDDVAAFLRTECPELEQKRRSLVAGAMEAVPAAPEPTPASTEEEAFAPTLIGDTGAVSRRSGDAASKPVRISSAPPVPPPRFESEAPAIALTRRKVHPTPPLAFPTTRTSIAFDRHSVPPKRSHPFLWLLVMLAVAGGVAFFRFPEATARALGAVGLSHLAPRLTAAAPPPPTEAQAPAPRPPVVPPPAEPSASSPPAAASSAPGASAAPSGSAAAQASSSSGAPASGPSFGHPGASGARVAAPAPEAAPVNSSSYSIYKTHPAPSGAPPGPVAPLPGPGDYLH